MTEEQEQIKVYELAKELGTDSISLLDQLKNLGILVKSHMSGLTQDQAQKARDSLSTKTKTPPKSGAKTSASKTVRKTPAAAKTAAAVPASQATAKASSTRTRRKVTSPEKSEAQAVEKTAEDTASRVSPVIRRRTRTDGSTETISTAPLGAASSFQEITHQSETADSSHAGPDDLYLKGGADSQEDTVATHSVSSHESEPSESHDVVVSLGPSEDTAAESTATQHSDLSKPSASDHISAPQSPVSPNESVRTGAQAPSGASAGVAPRRSFLKIVEAKAPPQRTMVKPTPSAPGSSAIKVKPRKFGEAAPTAEDSHIIKMSKERLDQIAAEEAAKKRGGGKDASIRPEDVNFADYRKKEMVFLPKKKKIPVGKELKKTQLTTPKAQKRVVEVNKAITVQDLANQLNVKAGDVIRKLMGMGQMATINQALDYDTALLIAGEYQYEVKDVSFKENSLLTEDSADPEKLRPRPPVVTVMGHVDHGKTSLLDAIRESNVAAGEAGGITQHIGAYTIIKNGKQITFIDTPGHEAFTSMRARGANVTDIVVLVVAADDGVMPQTREAISHAQEAKVPIVVAVNKIDKPGATPDKIKQQLAELNLLAEDWGGQTMFVPVSAIQKTNIDQLLEAILLNAEILELKADPTARATGVVLEAKLERGRGPVATLLVKKGSLSVGNTVISGQSMGRIRAMMDAAGRALETVGPGMAAEVLGLESVPNAGETFACADSESDARKILSHRQDVARVGAMASKSRMTLEQLFAKVQSGATKELKVILKADVYGSLEAVRDSLLKISTEQVKVNVIHGATGGVTESDVLLASASNAIIIGFNVRPETKARQTAESEHVEIKCYNIIYELLDDVKKAMTGLLDKKKVEKFLGRAEVRQVFSVPKVGTIAGSAVIDGKILRGASVRLLRESKIVFEGRMTSLKRFKDDAKEVATGYECGIGLENYNDIKPGDIIEAFEIELVSPELMAPNSAQAH